MRKSLRDFMMKFFSNPTISSIRDGGSPHPRGTLQDKMLWFFRNKQCRLVGKAYLDSAEIGDTTNYLDIDETGVVTLKGSAKRVLTLRAEIDYVPIIALTKPTQVEIGIFKGFSMPIWNDGVNADEQLSFRENVPGRWDGVSDMIFHILVALAEANDAGKKFQFQFSWNHAGNPNVMPVTSHPVVSEKTVASGSQYALYLLSFVLDYDVDVPVMAVHDILGGRLRRIAASSDEITGEAVVVCWHTHYIVDKMFKAP